MFCEPGDTYEAEEEDEEEEDEPVISEDAEPIIKDKYKKKYNEIRPPATKYLMTSLTEQREDKCKEA